MVKFLSLQPQCKYAEGKSAFNRFWKIVIGNGLQLLSTHQNTVFAITYVNDHLLILLVPAFPISLLGYQYLDASSYIFSMFINRILSHFSFSFLLMAYSWCILLCILQHNYDLIQMGVECYHSYTIYLYIHVTFKHITTFNPDTLIFFFGSTRGPMILGINSWGQPSPVHKSHPSLPGLESEISKWKYQALMASLFPWKLTLCDFAR